MIYELYINLTTSDDKMTESIYSLNEVVKRAVEISKCDNVHSVDITNDSVIALCTMKNGEIIYVDKDLPILLANE